MHASWFSGSERASAPVLVFFLIGAVFVVLLAGQTFRAGYRAEVSSILTRQATTTSLATLETIESELNTALRSAVYAAAYEIGVAGENRTLVEQRVVELLNERISAGWNFSNFKSIYVPPCDNLSFTWLQDGSVEVGGYLRAEVEHVLGPRAYGVTLRVSFTPRFERLRHLANRAFELAFHTPLGELERELNENFACEGFTFKLEPGPHVVVEDVWAAKFVVL